MDGTGVDAWSRAHGGVELSGVARWWVLGVQWLAAGPISRVRPDALSAAGVVAVAGALGAASAGGRWVLLVVPLVLLAGVLDGLDGAVALRTGRARPLGAVVDAVADRIGDLLLAGVLFVLGAPGSVCVAAAALVLLHEYLRARAQAAGMPGAGAVTVAERPTRLMIVGAIALGAGTLPAGTPLTGWDWAAVGAVGWVGVGVIGLVQLAVGVVRAVPPAFPAGSGPSVDPVGAGRPPQAGPTSPATISADSATSGSPPPGCAEPPTR